MKQIFFIVLFTFISALMFFRTASAAQLLFSTDFSGMTVGTYLSGPCLTMSGQSAGTLALNLKGGNPLKNYFVIDNSADTFWIDDTSSGSRQFSSIAPPSGHNGQRYVIGMECHADRRNEFNLVHAENWIPATKAYYLSVWLYLSSTWAMPSNEWYALSDVWQEESSGYLKSEFHIDNYPGQYEMNLQYGYPGGSGVNSKWIINNVIGHPPFGQWFNLKMYLNTQTGREILWIDDKLISDTDVDVPRDHPQYYPLPSIPTPWLITAAKIYTDTGAVPSGGYQLWISDLQIYDDIPSSVTTYDFSGRLTNKTGSPVNATVSVGSLSSNTDANGNYSLQISPGTYDVQYSINKFIIPNFYIKFPSINISSNLRDLVSSVTQYPIQNNKYNVSISYDDTKSKIVQTYSSSRPNKIIINGTIATEVSSLSQLKGSTWLYNSTESKLYINASIVQKCSDGTPYGQCSATKPKYCDNGNLIDRCSVCGCSSGNCLANDSCSGVSLPAYSISKTGNVINVINESNGAIVYSNADANLAFSAAFGYVKNGGNITVQPGTYVASGSGIFMQNCNNVNVNFQKGSLLTYTDWSNETIFNMWYDTNCTIVGITIDGNAAHQFSSYNADGVGLYDCSNCLVTGANITNVRAYGFNAGDDRVVVPSGVTNSIFSNNGWNGITFWGVVTTGYYAINNTVAYSSDVGISIPGGTGNKVIGNYVHDMNGDTGGGGNASWGIATEDNGVGMGTLIANNTVVNCSIGIALTSVEGSNIVEYNNITNVGCGISSAGVAGYNVITNNLITNWGWKIFYLTSGIASYYSPVNDMITFNTLTTTNTGSSSGNAIFLYTAVNDSIIYNTIKMPTSSGIPAIFLQTGSSSALIENNNIQAAVGIRINDLSCRNNRLKQNNLNNCTTAIVDGGTNTLIITPSNPVNTSILTINCPSLHGNIIPAMGSYLLSNSSQVNISLNPDPNYRPILNVDGKNVVLTGNSYLLSMNQDHFVYALFERQS